MKGRRLLVLLGITAVLVVLVVLRLGDKTPDRGKIKMGDRLFADLPVNAVASIQISDGDHQATLKKEKAGWQVEERYGYPADFDAIRDLVMTFSRMKIGRDFTPTPEGLARLSLLPPSSEPPEGRGIGLILTDTTGKTLVDVIVGKTRTPGDHRSGQYLKHATENTVFLVDGGFYVLKAAPEVWLKSEILKIGAHDVMTVTAYGADSQDPVYTLSWPEKGGPARMTPVPREKAANPEKLEQVFEALGPLVLDDVRKDTGSTAATTPPAKTPYLVYRLYDGREITVFPKVEKGDAGDPRYTVRIRVDTSKAALPAGAEPQTAPDAASDTDPAALVSKPADGDAAKPENRSAGPDANTPDDQNSDAIADPVPPQIDPMIENWVFILKKWQYDNLVTDPEQLLLPAEDKKPAGIEATHAQ
ncbi:DUF4340 domain-containing protein [Desulfosarcina sp. OttesenSCG-928-A07]|nr:DUF4340 domain-containing protein [Desulfosarcina sp. OttesenSCG-928-G17]MDL2328446.1 DUF4340 domain-containing protein [Desulfosarcina sp. OttesenSCG-928-A07]